MTSHPNKVQFLGLLTFAGIASDKSPSGARGHRALLTLQAVQDALPSLVGMGINVCIDKPHQQRVKCGVIESAELSGAEVWVTGHIWGKDFPDVISTLEASSDWGMSYECADAHVTDMRAETYEITKLTFTGAAVMPRAVVAYSLTDFVLL